MKLTNSLHNNTVSVYTWDFVLCRLKPIYSVRVEHRFSVPSQLEEKVTHYIMRRNNGM